MYNKVDDFMAKLSQQTAPMTKNESKTKNRTLEKISLNFEGNFGRYQILPMDNVVTDYPYVTLFGTREICIPRKTVNAEGVESTYNLWVKILPKSAYIMKDMTGRVVSSLTSEEDQTLQEAYTIFDQLYQELDGRNNRDAVKDLMRTRNYTIFNAMCLNKWNFEDTRKPDRQNFCGLFVCTAKGFTQAVEDNIKERTLMNNGDASWIEGIYSRQLSGRDGFVMFSISRSKTSAGYNVTVSHEYGRAKMLEGITISNEDAALMSDPVAAFLGSQANREENVSAESRRLFNAPLIKEAIEFMTHQLAAVRMAKQAGTDVSEAVKKTSAAALSTAGVSPAVAQNIQNNNTEPFTTPPVSQSSPMGTPQGNNNSNFGGAPFVQPGFAQFSGNNNGDLPF